MSTENPRPRAKEKACDLAIRRTLAYSAVFSYPISAHQIYTFLLTKNAFEENFFLSSLRRLVKKKHIKAKGGRYYLPGVRPVSWNLRYKYSQDLMEEARSAVNVLKYVPWIKMAAVTGAVACYNASKDDDIDIFIITEKNRLWISRFFVFLLLKIAGKYAQGGEHNRKLCCNLFADETALKWDKSKQNVYVAREILSMQPLLDRDMTYLKFLEVNSWVLRNFYNYKVDFPQKFPDSKLYKAKLVGVAEKLLRKFQMNYMKGKKTTEITTKNFVHFNKHDHAQEILDKYQDMLLTI